MKIFSAPVITAGFWLGAVFGIVGTPASAAGLDPAQWLPHGAPQMATPGSILYFSASTAPDGSRLIYPPDPRIDRWDYFLRATPGEGFTVPVWEQNADRQLVLSGYAAPSVTGKPPKGHPKHGLVAVPTEFCPAASSAPAGYHWVKLFLFRADLGGFPKLEPFEFLHVAVPADVTYAEMTGPNEWLSTQFTPLRFFARACAAGKAPQDLDMNRDCDEEQIVGFGLKRYSPQQGGDRTPAHPDAAPIYPLCAWQADR